MDGSVCKPYGLGMLDLHNYTFTRFFRKVFVESEEEMEREKEMEGLGKV